MDLVLRYLESAIQLRDLAAVENDPKLKAALEKQAEAYRALAEKRARERDLPLPDRDAS
jgi:hypothetical protein